MKKKDETIVAKMYKELYGDFSKLAHMRVAKGLDKKYSPIRVQKKFRKHPLYPKIFGDVEIANFIDDDRAQFTQFNIFTFIVFSILVVLVFAGWIYVHGLLNDVFTDIGIANDKNMPSTYSIPCIDNQSNTCTGSVYTNMTQAAQITFGNIYTGILALRIVAVVYILGLAICILLTNSLMKTNPLWFFLYILIGLLAVIFSPQVSNAYYNLLQSNIFGGELNNFSLASLLVLNLPILTMFIGIIGALFLFINLIRTGGQEVTL